MIEGRKGTGIGIQNNGGGARPKRNDCIEGFLRIREPTNHQEEVV